MPRLGVVHLSDGAPGLRLEAAGGAPGERIEAAFVFDQRIFARAFGEVSVILRRDLAAVVLFDVAACDDPLAAKRGQAVVNAAGLIGITPRTARYRRREPVHSLQPSRSFLESRSGALRA